jgi:uncharacterized membrane protein
MFKNFFQIFKEGFASMTIGRTLWVIVIIKLFIMFAILRVFFFPNFLNSKAKTAEEKAAYVREQLSNQELIIEN